MTTIPTIFLGSIGSGWSGLALEAKRGRAVAGVQKFINVVGRRMESLRCQCAAGIPTNEPTN